MENNIYKKSLLSILLILILLVGVSCGQKQEKPQQPKEKEEIPKDLEGLSEKTDSIIEDVEKIQEEVKKPEKPKEEEEKKKEEGSNQKEGGGGKEGQEPGGGEQEQQQGGGGGEEKKEEEEKPKEIKLFEMWQALEDPVKEIHSSWNNYEPKGIDDGARTEDIEKFEAALNEMTIATEEKNDIQILSKANEMTLYLSRFFDLYKDHPNGEMMRMKYYIRESYLYGVKNVWSNAGSSIAKTDDILNRLRPKVELDEKDKSLMEKLNLSLQDIKTSIKETNTELLKIKRDIALKNLEEIEKSSK